MVGHVTSNEEAQLAQTIEMFEVITQSQPQDYRSLEILKEAYAKLGREKDVVNTSKRVAKAYVLMGQLSSAILEYESILQRRPDDWYGTLMTRMHLTAARGGVSPSSEPTADNLRESGFLLRGFFTLARPRWRRTTSSDLADPDVTA